MMFRILLLIKLTSCVCGTFVVNVTQTSYQAEENQDITLEWTFTTTTDKPLVLHYIYCDMINHLKHPGVFHLHEGVEVSESQDEQFAGRVQFDKDVLREGRLRLHVSRLRTEDSGLYLCEVETNDGANYGKCRLNVTAARDQQPEPERPNTESRGRTVLYCGLGLTAAAALPTVCYCSFIHRRPDEQESSEGSERSCSSADDQRKHGDRQCEFYTIDTENT